MVALEGKGVKKEILKVNNFSIFGSSGDGRTYGDHCITHYPSAPDCQYYE